MTAPVFIEAGVAATIAGAALLKLNNLEANARTRPNSIIAFALTIAWIIVAINAAAITLLVIKRGYIKDSTQIYWLCAWTFVLIVANLAARYNGLLFNFTGRKAKQKRDSHSAVFPVVNATVECASDDERLLANIGNIRTEIELKTVRHVMDDTDEHRLAVDGCVAGSNRNG